MGRGKHARKGRGSASNGGKRGRKGSNGVWKIESKGEVKCHICGKTIECTLNDYNLHRAKCQKEAEEARKARVKKDKEKAEQANANNAVNSAADQTAKKN